MGLYIPLRFETAGCRRWLCYISAVVGLLILPNGPIMLAGLVVFD
ncbi:MAG TPA: hypothetical protein VF099_12685 [Ktedonobacterales bacterium]